MSMFHSASHMNITGGSFNIVHGTQNNYYNPDPQSGSERRLDRIQPGEEWKKMLYQEYQRIPIWRIDLLRTLHCVESRPQRRYMGAFQEDNYPKADRMIEIASIVDQDGRNESKPLLAVKYTGRGAKKLFAQDCIMFSRQKATNLAQLRGFNDSDIHIIIFNEELVSLEHFLEHYKHSMQAQCYLRIWYEELKAYRHPKDLCSALKSWLSSSRPFKTQDQLLWFRPQTGDLCFGPPQPELAFRPSWRTCRKPLTSLMSWSRHSLSFERGHFESPDSPPTVRDLNHHHFLVNNPNFPPLPRNTGNHALIDYLIRNFPERAVLSAACWNSSFRSSGLIGGDVWTRKMSLIDGGLLSKRNFALPFHRWAYFDFRTTGTGKRGGEYKAMENGEMRFLIQRTPRLHYSQLFCFTQYKGSSTYCERGEDWLAQAGRIFTHFGIPRREWESCRFITQIQFSLRCREQSRQQGRNDPKKLKPPCYLFVLPLPQCPDSTPDIETWLRGENLYYYSYNSEGGSAMTEEERILLGLPSLTSDVRADYLQWDDNAYEFMEKWQKAKGFDYTTADYAKSLGIPDLSANPQEERCFEDMTDSPDVLKEDPMDVDSDEVAHTREICSSSGLSEEVEDDRMDLD
ncbi:hypothetical protein PM082_016762 [Marasmius tenuissimus]|nr:hypothetical protein PM082_016762 [Marasmius tenuissimus]